MLATDLLEATVVDSDGRPLGRLHDVRLVRDEEGIRATGLVVGSGAVAAVAHTWGYAERRTSGPWLLRKLLEPASRAARLVAAEDVAEWGSETVTLRPGAQPVLLPEEAR